MTEVLYNPKIKPEHLARKAIVYLRQSSDKQVRQNKESQLLQYAMAERVRALGWQEVEIINNDLGSSAGLAAAQREGFERVLSSVALGEVGIVGSRELSRLSRTGRRAYATRDGTTTFRNGNGHAHGGAGDHSSHGCSIRRRPDRLCVEPTRLFHGQREAVESDPCSDSPAQPFDCRSKTSSARSGESEFERSCANMRRQSPHHPKAG